MLDSSACPSRSAKIGFADALSSKLGARVSDVTGRTGFWRSLRSNHLRNRTYSWARWCRRLILRATLWNTAIHFLPGSMGHRPIRAGDLLRLHHHLVTTRVLGTGSFLSVDAEELRFLPPLEGVAQESLRSGHRAPNYANPIHPKGIFLEPPRPLSR